jgi:glycosyltransferase involved in cell wall biosynthesis
VRVAYVTTGYPFVSHTFILNEVSALRELGVDVHTFAVTRSPDEEIRSSADREARDTTYAIRPPRLWHFLRAHLRAVSTAPERYSRTLRLALAMGKGSPRDRLWHLLYFAQAVVLFDECRRRRVRHVHAHFANVASDLALLAATLGGAEDGWRWSFTMHGPTEFYDVQQYRLAEKTRRADCVVCISLFARSQLMGLVEVSEWGKLQVVHCGVDTTRFRPASFATDANDAALRVLNVGRLVPEKGQAVLLRAVAEVARHGIAVDVRIAGSGPEEARLRRTAVEEGVAGSTTFLGALSHDQVRAEMAAADLLCLPSFAEGVPVVLMEGMSSGIPVVATRIMGIPELVEDGVSGLTVAPGDAAALSGALEALARDPSRRAEFALRGRERVLAEFDVHGCAQQLRDVFAQQIVSDPDAVVSR